MYYTEETRGTYGKLPKIPSPWLLKKPLAPPVPVNEPAVAVFNVVPAPISAPLPVPDPSPPAEPKKLDAIPLPPPKFVAVPPLDPVPTADPPVSDPDVVLAMLNAPLPLPKPPVGPVKTGVIVVTKVGLVKPLALPLGLPDVDA
jgi:hypothetical protein